MANTTFTPIRYDGESFINKHFSTSTAIVEACAENRSHQAVIESFEQAGKIFDQPTQNGFTFVAARLKFVESGVIAFYMTIYNVFVAIIYSVASLATLFNPTATFAAKKHWAKAVQSIALVAVNAAAVFKLEWGTELHNKVTDWTNAYAILPFVKRELNTLAQKVPNIEVEDVVDIDALQCEDFLGRLREIGKAFHDQMQLNAREASMEVEISDTSTASESNGSGRESPNPSEDGSFLVVKRP